MHKRHCKSRFNLFHHSASSFQHADWTFWCNIPLGPWLSIPLCNMSTARPEPWFPSRIIFAEASFESETGNWKSILFLLIQNNAKHIANADSISLSILIQTLNILIQHFNVKVWCNALLAACLDTNPFHTAWKYDCIYNLSATSIGLIWRHTKTKHNLC